MSLSVAVTGNRLASHAERLNAIAEESGIPAAYTYLGQFIDEAASGLTGIWSNTIGFPPARWLFLGGARKEREFKNFVRSSQIRTQVWYSGYPDLSVADVWNNSAIRRGLQGLWGLGEERAWLRRL